MEVSLDKCSELWNIVLRRLEDKITDTQIYTRLFLQNTSLHSIEGNKAIITVKSKTSKVLLESKYLDEIENALQLVSETDFRCIIKEESEVNPSSLAPTPIKTVTEITNFSTNLNPNLTFDNFIVGDSNREAHDASIAISSTPGKLFNPLFIYGKSGIGKTHLLNAIGNHVRTIKERNFKVLYISTSDFINDYINAVKTRDFDYLIGKYESVDLLLIDDIQFLAGKESTSEYFFTIFNKLIGLQKQIVLTSDRHPNKLRGVEERLVSRFSQGISINVTSPQFDTALAILKKKMEMHNLSSDEVSPEALEFIAHNFKNDIRQLEGALNRIIFYNITNKTTVSDTEDLMKILNTFDYVSASTLSIDKIIDTVADYYSLNRGQLISKVRTIKVALARHIAMYLCRSMLEVPYNKIGQEFGNRDHSTVINAIEKVESIQKTNPEYKVVISTLTKMLSEQQ